MRPTRQQRLDQLTSLRDALQRLVEVLECDPDCQWRNHFANCLEEAQYLLIHGFEQSALNDLSGSIRQVYGGSGSFSDYAPLGYDPESGTWKLLPGAEAFSEASGEVYRWADELRVIGKH